jgi:GntR family transcriptional regulator
VLLHIDLEDRKPIYQQVADGLRMLIATGELAEGQALPPVRQLASDLGVNLNTIAAAYRELQSDGLIAVRHGSGATVASRTGAKQSPEELRQPLRMALAQMVLSGVPAGQILDAVRDELSVLLKGVKV